MKNNIWIILFALLFTLSCNNTTDYSNAPAEATVENSEVSAEATAENNQEDPPKETTASNPNRQKETVNDKVADLIGEQAFFEGLKGAESGTEGDVKIVITSSYEYLEKEGIKVLDGKACVDITAMGYGSKTCANYKDGVLDGVAYKGVSTPYTYMLKLVYDAGTLQTASIFTQDMDECMGKELPKGITLAEAQAELKKALLPENADQLKAVDCPAETSELYN